jgi:virulence-associated protein VapD
MTDEIDPTTGEIKDPISVRAARNTAARRHWDRVDGIVIRTPDEGRQSQYELAFLEAQMEIVTVIETDATAQISDKRSYGYTTLGQLMAHVRPILNKHGFTFKQGTGSINRKGMDAGHTLYMPIFMKLTHVSTGESEVYLTEMPLTKLDPQAVKSAKTYGKRQLIEDTFGIASADDDAIAAMTERNFWRDDETNIIAGISEKIKLSKSIDDLQKLGRQNKEGITGLSQEAYDKITGAYGDRLKELKEALEAEKAKAPEAEAKRGKPNA